jgi:hypothetical protein
MRLARRMLLSHVRRLPPRDRNWLRIPDRCQPVVLLYPGERRGTTGLSFMGMLNSDNDYRPRIYP